MSVTIEQKIAQKEMELARLREQKRSIANGQKIILGGLVLRHAEQNAGFRQQLIALAEKHITREADKKRITPLVEKLKQLS